MSTAQSFSFAGEDPEKAAKAFAQSARRVTRPTGAVVFVAGNLGDRLVELGRAVAQAVPGVPLCLAAGSGVVSERGEVEGQAAASGIIWSGGSAETFSVTGNHAEALGSRLLQAIRATETNQGRSATALMFARPTGLAPHVLEPLSELRRTRVLGAGTVGEAPVVAVSADGNVSPGPAGGIVLHGLTAPLVRASAACRLLMPLKAISKTRGSMVLEIEGAPALEVLSSVADNLADQPLVFVALAQPVGPDLQHRDPTLDRSERAPERPEVLIRAVQGVDPVRRGLLVSDEVRPGMRLAFAVRDAKAAREDLQLAVRDVLREANGAAPRFAIYINCAGRGAGLYGQRDVDLKILKARLGELPLAGMQSSFEVSEVAGKPALQLYTGVLGLFTAPS